MNPILGAASEIESFCREQRWRYCIIGGLAVLRWGEPRGTRDVDLTILTGFGNEDRFISALLGRFAGRRRDTDAFARQTRVVLIQSSQGIPIDVSLGAIPFEERAVSRASAFRIDEELELLTCSAEDLVVFKAFAGREQDWLDIEGVVTRQASILDAGLVWRELDPLLELKEEAATATRLARLLPRPAQ